MISVFRFTCDDGCTGKAEWKESSATACSATCGGGTQTKSFSCKGYWDEGSCGELMRSSQCCIQPCLYKHAICAIVCVWGDCTRDIFLAWPPVSFSTVQ